MTQRSTKENAPSTVSASRYRRFSWSAATSPPRRRGSTSAPRSQRVIHQARIGWWCYAANHFRLRRPCLSIPVHPCPALCPIAALSLPYRCPIASVQSFCTGSRRPHGPLAPPTRRARRSSRWRSRYGGANAGRLARKAKIPRGRSQPGSSRAAAGFDKGTLAMAHIGLTGAGRSQPDSPDSVRAIAPCQIPPLRQLVAFPYRPCSPIPSTLKCQHPGYGSNVEG